MDNVFEDARPDADELTLEVEDNADGETLVINILSASNSDKSIGIALTADEAHRLADYLHMIAAGL